MFCTHHAEQSAETGLVEVEPILRQDALRRAGRPGPGQLAVVLAFGPGLTLYAALLRAG